MKKIFLLVVIGFLSCSDNSNDNLSTGGCEWHGNCSTMAPEGAYDCSGNSIVKCVGGKWEHVKLCSSTENSDGYSCTCKGGCGVNTTECSYAFDVCEGQSYETCGENATASTSSGKWECI